MINLKEVAVLEWESHHRYFNVDNKERLSEICKRHNVKFKKVKKFLSKHTVTKILVLDIDRLMPSWKRR